MIDSPRTPYSMAEKGRKPKGYDTRFGQPGGPKSGRPAGSFGGRHAALMTLDKVMAEAGNQRKLDVAFRKAIDENVLKFFRQYIMPLLPREAIVKLGGENEAINTAIYAALVKLANKKEPFDDGA